MSEKLSDTPAWRSFSRAATAATLGGEHLRVIDAATLKLDLSTQPDSPELRAAGLDLLHQQQFESTRASLFTGAPINITEERPAWHTALRAAEPPPAVAGAIASERERLRAFVDGADAHGKYSCVLHLGIGGSDWGPRMVVRALQSATPRRTIRFVSNIDGHAITEALRGLDPHDTLIVIASKTFTTIEPLTNSQIAIEWLRAAGVAHPLERIAAVTANPDAALDFGVAPDRIFRFWDWVGGRYSLWSSIGLPIALQFGTAAFDELLMGAAEMDEHFLNAPLAANAPVQMALAGVANCSVRGFGTQALVPYDARLSDLVAWAQQLEMESLGKGVALDGTAVDLPISPVVWGMPGTDGQHTFFQWLHQSGTGAPVDFILCEEPDHAHRRNHVLLVANCLAQRAALLRGKPYDLALAETLAGGTPPEKAAWLAHHRIHEGGRPSSLIVLPRLTAQTLGALLALYEHKVFTQAVIWGINPFDQWGVEYGKVLAKEIIRDLDSAQDGLEAQDASTAFWIERLARAGT